MQDMEARTREKLLLFAFAGLILAGVVASNVETGTTGSYAIYVTNYSIGSGNITEQGNNIYYHDYEIITQTHTGWVEYIDTQYNSTNRFNTNSALVNFPNNAGANRSKEKPIDDNFYNGTHINPLHAGDLYFIRLRFNAEPQVASTYCEMFINIGGSVGQLPLRLITFPRGVGVEEIVTFTNMEYALDTWYNNGGQVQIDCSNNVEIWDISMTIHRAHQGFGVYP